jgi:guanine deaminase
LSANARIIRGRVLSFGDDPAIVGASAYSLIEDGAVVLSAGIIAEVGEAGDVLPRASKDALVDDHAGCLIMPGFIDAHVHYSQTQVIGSYGAQLLDWLQNYTFVEEQKFVDPAHSARVADFFLDELFRSGTTTAMVYCTVHPESVEAFFAAAEGRGARMIAGKVMMDRHAPPGLMDTAQQGYDESKALIARWRGRGRLGYAITPRFAVTSTQAQLDAAGALAREFPDCYVQTHADENKAEIALVAELYPEAKSYIDVYARAGLTGPRSVFGHCIHLLESEVAELVASRSIAAFCPTSNLFLGSGLFDEARLAAAGVRIALATDVGGGTSYSMLHTAAEGYKVLQLNRQSWPARHAFYRMTLGNARALSLDDRIGSIEAGKEADLVVLDPNATPALAHRMETAAGDLEVELFALMMMGDDRAVRQTYVAGVPMKFDLTGQRVTSPPRERQPFMPPA